MSFAMTKSAYAAAFSVLLLAPSSTPATTSQIVSGEFVVHYVCLPTEFLSPLVAKRTKIDRDHRRAFLSVVVLKRAEGREQPVPASVRVRAVNLISQLQMIHMREIFEQGSVSYIGDFRVAHEDVLKFTLNVVPEGESRMVTVNFQEHFRWPSAGN